MIIKLKQIIVRDQVTAVTSSQVVKNNRLDESLTWLACLINAVRIVLFKFGTDRIGRG